MGTSQIRSPGETPSFRILSISTSSSSSSCADYTVQYVDALNRGDRGTRTALNRRRRYVAVLLLSYLSEARGKPRWKPMCLRI